MIKITKQDLINNVIQNWQYQYPKGKYPDKDEKLEKLIKLEPKTEQSIANLIGNDSWTKLNCDECAKEVETVVILYNSTYCCKDCLIKALELL